MGVTDVETDSDDLRLVITCEWAAAPERVWSVWADPRQLEHWWGPPSHPATFTTHELRPGGQARYFMTGPEGERYHGWWEVLDVEAPHRLVLRDGFADAQGEPDPGLPVTTTVVTLAGRGDGGTRMAIETQFASADDMDRTLEMGMVEGMTSAIGQIEVLLAD